MSQTRAPGLHEQEARARKTFELADADDSGSLSVEEMPSIMRGMGLDLTDEELHRYAKKLFKELDSDHSGNLDFNEVGAAAARSAHTGAGARLSLG